MATVVFDARVARRNGHLDRPFAYLNAKPGRERRNAVNPFAEISAMRRFLMGLLERELDAMGLTSLAPGHLGQQLDHAEEQRRRKAAGREPLAPSIVGGYRTRDGVIVNFDEATRHAEPVGRPEGPVRVGLVVGAFPDPGFRSDLPYRSFDDLNRILGPSLLDGPVDLEADPVRFTVPYEAWDDLATYLRLDVDPDAPPSDLNDGQVARIRELVFRIEDVAAGLEIKTDARSTGGRWT